MNSYPVTNLNMSLLNSDTDITDQSDNYLIYKRICITVSLWYVCISDCTTTIFIHTSCIQYNM